MIRTSEHIATDNLF